MFTKIARKIDTFVFLQKCFLDPGNIAMGSHKQDCSSPSHRTLKNNIFVCLQSFFDLERPFLYFEGRKSREQCFSDSSTSITRGPTMPQPSMGQYSENDTHCFLIEQDKQTNFFSKIKCRITPFFQKRE